MLKTLLKFVFGLAVLVIVLVIAVAFLVDANQYKAALESAVADNSSYELTIAGDLDLQLFPDMGLTLNDVRLRNPSSPQELASTSAVSLKIDRSALFSGRLLIQEFAANDFHINYTIDESGRNSWATDEVNDSGPEQPQSSSTGESSDIVSTTFERISISNASIDIQDMSQGSRYSLANVNLDSSYTNTDGRPFPLDLNFDFISYNETTGLPESIAMGLRSIISANLNNGSVDIREFNFNLTPMLLQGQVTIEGLNDSPVVAGSLQANSFDVLGLMQTLGNTNETEPVSIGSAPSPVLAFQLSFSADNSQVEISELTGTLDDTELEGDMTVRLATEFSPMSVNYNLSMTELDLSPYISSDKTGNVEGQGNSTVVAETDQTVPIDVAASPLPVDLLSAFDLIGGFSIDSIIADDYLLEDINVFTNIESSILDIEIQPIIAFDGTIDGNIRVDGRSSDAPMTSRLNVNQLNLVDLAPSVSRFDSVTGKLNIISEYNASAASTDSLANSLTGSTQFAISENSVDIGVIKQVFTTIAALSPTGGSIQQWPDQIQFNELGGYIVLENGIGENQQINLKMDNFQLDGTGGIDLDADTFAYQFAFTLLGEPELQTIPIDELYHNVQWPVQCSAPFAADVSQYCRPDITRIREIFAQLGSNALRNELEETITDQVPEELRDTARGLLRNILN